MEEQLGLAVRSKWRKPACGRSLGRLHEDHVRAEVGKQSRAILGRDAFTKIDDAEMTEG